MKLPRPKESWFDVPSCPWCDAHIEDVQVSLRDVLQAHNDGGFGGFAYQNSGRLAVDCPDCKRPLEVELSAFDLEPDDYDGPTLFRRHQTHAVRSDVDLEYAKQCGLVLPEQV